MADNEGGGKNPILEWLTRFRAIYWLLAFLALAGSALKWGSETLESYRKFKLKSPEMVAIEKQEEVERLNQLGQAVRFNAAATSFDVAWLASSKTLFAEANANGAQVTATTLFSDDAEKRRSLATKLDFFKITPQFADLDFSEPQYGQISDATAGLASAIKDKKGEEAKRYFLFEYYISRLMLEYVAAGNLGHREPRLAPLVLRINENIPQGVAAFQPSSGTFADFCNYWIAYFPLSKSTPAYGKRDEMLFLCQNPNRKL